MKSRIRQILAQRAMCRVVTTDLVRAAVLLPLYESSGEYYVVFTKRTEMVEKHKGQICFPGGTYQKEDIILLNTALRESWEEIGLNPEDVEVLGEFDEMPTHATNFLITPFVGIIPHPYRFEVSRDEVEEIIEVPLSVLRDGRNYWEETRVYCDNPLSVPFYKYGDRVIWGATARILRGFLEAVFEDEN